MRAPAFDGISRELADESTRRGLFRLFGGVAALGALGVVGVSSLGESAEARRRGKKRRKKNKKRPEQGQPGQGQPGQGQSGQSQTCAPGTFVAQLNVGGNGAIVETPVLAQGQAYRFQASGAAALSSLYSFDAEYIFSNTNTSTGVDVDSGIDAGLSIDDPTVDDSKSPKWGAYNINHVYETQYIGKGRPAQLKMHDGDYSDNSGSVLVTITCA
jgi:hypothetical protein